MVKLENFLTGQGVELTAEVIETLPAKFNNPFSYVPHQLCREAALDVQRHIASIEHWQDELSLGKMFGVLVAASPDNKIGFLAAFSGNIMGENNTPYFVPPVYDLLSPHKFYKKGEALISEINATIARMELELAEGDCIRRLEQARQEAAQTIAAMKEEYAAGKAERERRRSMLIGMEGPQQDIALQLQAIDRESQFQKGEMRRKEKSLKVGIEALQIQLQRKVAEIDGLKAKRKEMSASLQNEIFEKFVFLNAKGERKSLPHIFEDYAIECGGAGFSPVPPAGAGECAAPKLLQYAYLHNYRPLAMGEFWCGNSPKGEVRNHGEFYPSCKGKCAPILHFMLQGLDAEQTALHESYGCAGKLEVIYEDDFLLAVNKPAGLLSVPGKEKNQQGECGKRGASVASELNLEYVGVAHRLDMHTSGMLLVAKTESVFKELQRQFAQRLVQKRYIAVLDGIPSPSTSGECVEWYSRSKGKIILPLSPDHTNRPYQIADFENGKEAVTEFNIIDVSDGRAVVEFYPLTGRTHQLRVHSAHKLGLNVPITGDLLYGKADRRLMLHAQWIKFTHPQKGSIELETHSLKDSYLKDIFG